MVYYRGNGAWGTGKGSNLTAAEFDSNTWTVQQQIDAKAAQGVGLANFVVSGNEMWAVLTDHAMLGPYTLPVAAIAFRGNWTHGTQYYANDIFTENGSTYIVLINHVSASTFDAGANDGSGHDFYALLLMNPAGVLPPGGTVGQALTKATTTDYSTLWKTLTLAGMSDVTQTASPDTGDLVQWNGAEFVYVDPSSLGFAPLESPGADAFLPITGGTLTGGLVVQGPADLKVQTVTQSGASLSINRTLGENCALSLTASITSVAVSGWPAAGVTGKVRLVISNTGAFGITGWPAGTIWPGGTAPTITSGSGKKDIVLLMSDDGGTTIFGSVVGQDYH